MYRVICEWHAAAATHMLGHVTYECVMSYMTESCDIGMSHVT